MSKVRSARSTGEEPLVRIGELARRAGIPAATLRAWERRYGVVEPRRGPSGYRLYTAADERRLRSMVGLVDQGVAPAEAAARVIGAAVAAEAAAPAVAGAGAGGLRTELFDALVAFDNAAAEQVMDRALAVLSAEAFVGELVLPILRDIGDGWSKGQVSVAQEHFSSSILRGRMLGLARAWGAGEGPLALLACAPGELHDLGLIAFGVALRGRGWRVTFLGSDVPIDTIVACAEQIEPDVVVVCALGDSILDDVAPELGKLARRNSLLLAGAGADADLARRLGAGTLTGEPVAEAASLAV
jgi:MerR family transcriptional regulator, light-induced transcriptional regulator